MGKQEILQAILRSLGHIDQRKGAILKPLVVKMIYCSLYEKNQHIL